MAGDRRPPTDRDDAVRVRLDWRLIAANGETVEDAENVCRAALGTAIRRFPIMPPLFDAEYEDALSKVREEAVVQARRYRGGDSGSSLRHFLLQRLGLHLPESLPLHGL